MFIASMFAKGLQSALMEHAEGINGTKLAAAEKADSNLLFELLHSLEKEPRAWSLLNHPVTEKPVPWAGYLLWNALKKRYELKAIPQEIFLLKMKCLNLKCHGNVKGYIQETQETRKRLFA